MTKLAYTSLRYRIIVVLCTVCNVLTVFSEQQGTVSDPVHPEGSISAAINQHLMTCTFSNNIDYYCNNDLLYLSQIFLNYKRVMIISA